MADEEGLTTRELEKKTGLAIGAKVQFVLTPDSIYCRAGTDYWYGRRDREGE